MKNDWKENVKKAVDTMMIGYGNLPIHGYGEHYKVFERKIEKELQAQAVRIAEYVRSYHRTDCQYANGSAIECACESNGVCEELAKKIKEDKV